MHSFCVTEIKKTNACSDLRYKLLRYKTSTITGKNIIISRKSLCAI